MLVAGKALSIAKGCICSGDNPHYCASFRQAWYKPKSLCCYHLDRGYEQLKDKLSHVCVHHSDEGISGATICVRCFNPFNQGSPGNP
ncbi:MAG: hypothetical protein ACQES5_09245 [Thermodesulfobacteriota bacterium]